MCVTCRVGPQGFDKFINDGTHTSFAKFSRSFRKFFEVFVACETCWDLFGPTRMHSDTFGYVQKRSEACRRFRNFRIFPTFFVLVPDTDEANDEMCAPTALKCAFSSRLVVVVAALAEKTRTGFAGNENEHQIN